MPRVVLRAVLVWLVIIAGETVHGVLRTLLLVPLVGDFPARRVSVLTGSLLIVGVAWVFARWIGAGTRLRLLAVGLPGQLTDGPRMGRWADAHNARPAYHCIMVRGLAALAAVMPKDDPDLPAVVGCLRLALLARNPDFEKGIVNADSTVEALVRVKQLPPHVAAKLAKCHTDEALAALERYAADGFRAKKSPLGPGAWGQLLAYRKGQER